VHPQLRRSCTDVKQNCESVPLVHPMNETSSQTIEEFNGAVQTRKGWG